jgi:hypothetical protein
LECQKQFIVIFFSVLGVPETVYCYIFQRPWSARNSLLLYFSASLECQKQFISLQKIRTHENIQRYLEKKEERINAQKNKPPPPPPPQKKLKTS